MLFAWKARLREEIAPCCCKARLASFSCLASRMARWCMSRCRSSRRWTSNGLTPLALNQPARSTSSKRIRSRSSRPCVRIAWSSASKSKIHISRRLRSSSHCLRSPTGSVLAVCSFVTAPWTSFQLPTLAKELAFLTASRWPRDSSSSSRTSHFHGKGPAGLDIREMRRSISRQRPGTLQVSKACTLRQSPSAGSAGSASMLALQSKSTLAPTRLWCVAAIGL
mmetsp:Transcript_43395/g.86048  ORF Transcript_43395/g.86048 Transcript_43395/m.86048 type:complete len:223 (-) Transcript_43395:128-796(-)